MQFCIITWTGHTICQHHLVHTCADTLIPNFTVYEMLMYTIELKQEQRVPLADKRVQVEAVLQQLNLDVCRDVLIGSQEKRGISGQSSGRSVHNPTHDV